MTVRGVQMRAYLLELSRPPPEGVPAERAYRAAAEVAHRRQENERWAAQCALAHWLKQHKPSGLYSLNKHKPRSESEYIAAIFRGQA